MTEVATTPEAQVPALATTPALEIGSDDIVLPRLYIGQSMSDAVKDELVKTGDIYIANGKDDPDPVILAKAKGRKDGVDPDEGPVVHVLAMRRGKSVQQDGDLVLFDYNDPEAPPEAWVTYNYVIALPEVDDEVPAKWLLTRSGTPTAKRINTVLKKNEIRGPAYEIAFRVGSDFRENTKGDYFVPVIRHIDATDENMAVARKLSESIASAPDVFSTGPKAQEPAI